MDRWTWWQTAAVLAVCLVSAGWALSIALPALGAGLGLFGALIVSGTAAAAGIASWAVPVGALGVAAAGSAVAYRVTLVVVDVIKKDPVYGLAPLFGLLGVLSTELAVETSNTSPVARLAIDTAAGAALIAAAVLFKQDGLGFKAVAAVLALVPVGIILLNILGNGWSNLAEGFADVPPSTIAGLACIVLVLLLLAVLLAADFRRQAHGRI